MLNSIAIVDDEPGVLRALKRVVEASGMLVQVYSSGEQFLDACLDQVACAVLDINMGGMSGIETKRCMTVRGLDIPVIFMTALDSPAVQQEAVSAGCAAYLRKPFLGKVLMDAIRSAVIHEDQSCLCKE